MTETLPLVSILIGAKDRPDALIRCVKSVLAQAYKNLEVIVLDDNSDEKLCSRLVEAVADSRVKCIRSDTTLGVAGGRNKLIKEAKSNFLVILDDDAAFRNDDSLNRIMDLFDSHPDVGLFAFLIINIIDDKEVGIRVPFRRAVIKRNPEITNSPQYVSCFLGGGHAIRKSVFDKCGLYQQDFVFGGEELDLSYRIIQNGYKIFYTPDVIVNHYPKYIGLLTKQTRKNYLYFAVRNKIWINYKYLPWPAFIVNTAIWSVVRIAASLFNGGFIETAQATAKGFATLKKLKRTPLNKEAIRYIRLNKGRLFF
jgi:GT2 family glycosyltransferase